MRNRALRSCVQSPRAVLVSPLFFRAARLRDAFTYVEKIAVEHGGFMHLTSEKSVAFEAMEDDGRSILTGYSACLLFLI